MSDKDFVKAVGALALAIGFGFVLGMLLPRSPR